jgi:DNA-binding NarL/FixJ family response regulator
VNLLLFGQEQLAMSAMSWALESHGYVVSIAGDLEELRQRLEADRAEVCIVWDDPTRDEGVRAVEEAHRGSEATVLVLTDCSVEERCTQVVEAGAVACVDKATDLEQLVAIIASARARRKDSTMPPLLQTPMVRDRRGPERYLTPQELEALRGMVQGESTAEIATRLGVRSATARTHIQNVLMKLGVSSRVAAVAYAVEHSVVEIEVRPARGRRAGDNPGPEPGA